MNIAKLSINRPIFISCIVILMLVLGFTSLRKMGVDQFPDVTIPVVSVTTLYPGAPPQDVELLISKPIEDELGSLSGLNRISSQNLESVSIVVAEFKYGSDIKAAEQQIRDRVGNIRNKFPNDAKDPIIRKMDPSDLPIMQLAVKSKISSSELYDMIDDNIKPQLERIDGVGLVNIVGARKREIQVLVNKKSLQDRELTLLQVANRIAATSKDVPIGKVENAAQETVMRASGEFSNLDALKKVNISFIGSDRAVRLSEIATVHDGLERETNRARLNGDASMIVDVYKQSGGNTAAVSKNVIAMINSINTSLKQKNIDAEVFLVRDGARPIRLNIDDVYESILIGIVLCIIVVFFFLGSARSTLITGLALPNSLLGAFIIMYAMGFTINIMTLLALSLAVGLLIDDAIVVRENIFRHLEMGEEPKVAAEKGTMEVILAVIATTLVVIAVFGPIAFLSGIVGQFFKQFGLTIVFAMLISLFDALTVAPMLSAYLATATEHVKGTGPIGMLLNAFDRFQNKLEDIYEHAVRFSLKKPILVLGFSFLIFVGSMGLIKGIPKTFLPPADTGEFVINMEMPPGTSLEKMSHFAAEIEERVRKESYIDLVSTTVGNTNSQVNKASIYIRLVDRKKRNMNTTAAKSYFRQSLADKASEAIIKVSDYDPFGGGQRPFNLVISGSNLEELSAYVEKVKARMLKIPGLVDLDSNYRLGQPEFQVVFDRDKAETLGVSTGTAGAELRSRVEGTLAGTYRQNGKEYNIRVQLEEASRDLKREFASTQVPNVNYNLVSLSKIASPKETSGFSQINRMNKSRYVLISGDLGPDGALNSITQETTKIVTEELPIPPGMAWAFIGQAEDFKDLMSNIILAMSLGILFIYLVLASLYESFITPFTILLALPLAMCGAFAALYLAKASINIFSLIGIVMLLGVVAKNSILLVDYTLQLMETGMSRSDALIKAGRTRLRPILMTSFALIAGTIPIAVGLNEASAQRTPMGIAIIGGLISSTLLTLLVVPAAFGYIDRFRLWVGAKLLRIRGVSH